MDFVWKLRPFEVQEFTVCYVRGITHCLHGITLHHDCRDYTAEYRKSILLVVKGD